MFILKNLANYICKQVLDAEKTKKPNSCFNSELYKNVYITTRDGVKIGCYIYEPVSITQDTKFFIFLHGVGVNRQDIKGVCRNNIFNNNSVLVVPDYRGFGDSEGEFSKEGGNYDLLACFEFIIRTYNPHNISVIAVSFGTAVLSEYINFITSEPCCFLNPKSAPIEDNLPIKDEEFTKENSISYISLEHPNSKPFKDNSNDSPGTPNLKNLDSRVLPDKIFLVCPFSSFCEILNDFLTYRVVSFFLPGVEKIISSTFSYNTKENFKGFDSCRVFLYHGIRDSLVSFVHSIRIWKNVKCSLHLNESHHNNIFESFDVQKDIKDRVFEEEL